MKIDNREEFIKLLEFAKEKGALKLVEDVHLRDIRIESADGSKFRIEWYCNLCTLKANGLSIWFDEIKVMGTHTCFKIALHLFYRGEIVAHIGKVYDHLTGSFEV